MFRVRNILTKPQWMGIAAVIMAFVMILNPVLALAEEGTSDEQILLFDSDGTEIVIGGNSSQTIFEDGTISGSVGEAVGGSVVVTEENGGSAEGRAADIITSDEIWALVDQEELRSLVDVETISQGIDELAILDSIDRDALRAEIDGKALLEEIPEEDIREEFVQRKLEREYFVVDENGKGLIVDEETAKTYKNSTDKTSDTTVVTEDSDALETAADLNDSSLSEVVSEETRVLDDGREVKTFKVKTTQEFVDQHPIDVVNVAFPVIGNKSPFDFVIDPMKLIYQTGAARYGGGVVEENASVLFENTNSEYRFSHKSDMLKIVNKSNVPVRLIVTANIKNPESIPLVNSDSELTGGNPSLFMALADEEGVSSVITSYGEAVIVTVLNPVPDGTYSFVKNEATGKYDYYLNDGIDESVFDSFSFGVVAACNTEANWDGVDSRPIIGVNWKVEQIETDWDAVNAELEAARIEQLMADEEEFAAFKLVKIDELVEMRFVTLLRDKLEELKELELQARIDEEVLLVAYVKLAEMSGVTAEEIQEIFQYGNGVLPVKEATGEESQGATQETTATGTPAATESQGQSQTPEQTPAEGTVIIQETGGDTVGNVTETHETITVEESGNQTSETVIIEETKPPQAAIPSSGSVEFFETSDGVIMNP